MQISENKMKEINDYMAELKIIIEGFLKLLDKKYRKEILMELLQTECGINKNSAEDVAPSKMEHEGRMQISENKMKEINDYMAESKIIIEGLLKFLDKKYRKEILMELLQTECGMNENSAEDVAPYVEH